MGSRRNIYKVALLLFTHAFKISHYRTMLDE